MKCGTSAILPMISACRMLARELLQGDWSARVIYPHQLMLMQSFAFVSMKSWMACDKHDVSSDGNLLNFGYADAVGANVNRNNLDNVNDNLGVVSSRRNQISKSLSCDRLLDSNVDCVIGAVLGF